MKYPMKWPPIEAKDGEAIVKFDETEKVYIDTPHCSCFVRVDYFVHETTNLKEGHAQVTLGEIFKFEAGKKYRIKVEEVRE